MKFSPTFFYSRLSFLSMKSIHCFVNVGKENMKRAEDLKQNSFVNLMDFMPRTKKKSWLWEQLIDHRS